MSQGLEFQHTVNMTHSSPKSSQESDITSIKDLTLVKASIGADNPLLNTYAGQIAQFILEGNWQSALGLYDFMLEYGGEREAPKNYYMFWDNGHEYSDHNITLFEIPISVPAHEAKAFLEHTGARNDHYKPFVISIHSNIAFCNDEKGDSQIGVDNFCNSYGWTDFYPIIDPRQGQSHHRMDFEYSWKYMTRAIAQAFLEWDNQYYPNWQPWAQQNYDFFRQLLRNYLQDGRVPTWSEYVAGATKH